MTNTDRTVIWAEHPDGTATLLGTGAVHLGNDAQPILDAAERALAAEREQGRNPSPDERARLRAQWFTGAQAHFAMSDTDKLEWLIAFGLVTPVQAAQWQAAQVPPAPARDYVGEYRRRISRSPLGERVSG